MDCKHYVVHVDRDNQKARTLNEMASSLARSEDRVSLTSEFESSSLKPAKGFAKPNITGSVTHTNYKIYYSREYLCEPQNGDGKSGKRKEL